MIFYDSEIKDNISDGVPVDAIKKVIGEHCSLIEKYKKMERYYLGKHDILERTMTDSLPNNKIICNFAKYITDMATGYLIGKPVTYSSAEGLDLTEILDTLKNNSESHVNAEIAKDCSVFGKSCELLYTDTGAKIRMTNLSPAEAFVVYDDTVEHNPMFGVHYYQKADKTTYSVTVYTDERIYSYSGGSIESLNLVSVEEHYFSMVPLHEFLNNEDEQGDFEQLISLIDAYNKLTSDRLNGKEQDIDAILATYGVEEFTSEQSKQLREQKILSLPSDSKAEWLLKQLSEEGSEILRNALKDDIHKFSMVPDLTDENFAGNTSGVAMKYKVLGFEQMTAIKERFFKRSLYYRLELMYKILNIKIDKGDELDISKIDIVFTRNLPANELELAQMVSTLDAVVSRETLLGQLPFVGDPKEEARAVKQEEDAKLATQKQMFNDYENDGNVTVDE